MARRMRGSTSAIVAMSAVAALLATRAAAQTGGAAALKVEATVAAEVERTGRAEVVLVLADQADLSAAYTMTDPDARGWYVYETLREHSHRSQQALRRRLERAGIGYRSFWAVNAITTAADTKLLRELSGRADVKRIESNRPLRWVDDPVEDRLSLGPLEPTTVEWGVANVNAPAVWELGYGGAGIVVANQDTGIEWQHPALVERYRGWDGAAADHDYNWYDAIHGGGGACGADSPAPCDDNGHGTHTLGTSIGWDGSSNQIGVAPEARWIGCRNMDQGVGTPATYTECFQFFLAPTEVGGGNPDPTRRPHVMNNSWACPPSEGCAVSTLETAVQNAEAAGIFVVASAGNSGPGCATVGDPPAVYAATFSVGAITGANLLASFSSRGPVTADGSGRMKPDLSAPGSTVRSSIPGGGYGYKSGTSMASPHVAGVVALLWSARPHLARDIGATRSLLLATANPAVSVSPAQTCGGIASTSVPNNSFGYGRVDVLAAVNAAANPIASPSASATPTDTPPPATATLTATVTPTVTPTESPTVTPTAVVYAVSGTVRYRVAGRPVAGVTMSASGAASASTSTDGAGAFALSELPAGAIALTAAKNGDFGGGISALDASYILQAVVGFHTLDANERLAGDVTGNGSLSALDASRILQFGVGLLERFEAATACDSDWLFVPIPAAAPNQQVVEPVVTGASCQRGAIAYTPLAVGATGQDFLGVLLGDVTGNWQPALGGPLSRDDNEEGSVHVGRPRRRGGSLDLPVILGAGTHAAALIVDYDRAALKPRSVRRPHTGAPLVAANLTEPGVVRLAAARASAGAPATVLLRFAVLDARGANRLRVRGSD